MKHIVSSDLVKNSSGTVFDRVRSALGLGYVLTNGRLRRLRGRVAVVEENVFDDVPESMAPSSIIELETPFRWVEDVIPAGVDQIFVGSEVPDFGGTTLVPDPGGDSVFSLTPPTPRPFVPGVGPRSNLLDFGGSFVPPQFTFPVVWEMAPLDTFEFADSSPGFVVPELQVPVLPEVSLAPGFVSPPPVFDEGGQNTPHIVLPLFDFSVNGGEVLAESIPFASRLSVYRAGGEEGAEVYRCRLQIPGLADRMRTAGGIKNILQKISEHEEFQAEVAYLLGMKNILETAIAERMVYSDFDFWTAVGENDNPHTLDIDVKPKYHFYDPGLENKTSVSELQMPNFYLAGKSAGDFSRNVNVNGSHGTEFSCLMISGSEDELGQFNQYFFFGDSFPFGVELSADLTWSPVAKLIADNDLLKQAGMNFTDPSRALGKSIVKRNVVVEQGGLGSVQSFELMRLGDWLMDVYRKDGTLFFPSEAETTVISFGGGTQLRGAEKNKQLRSSQAKEVLVQLERMLSARYRSLFGCFFGDYTATEKMGFSADKVLHSSGELVHRLMMLHSGLPGKADLFDSQVLYGKDYLYRVFGKYFLVSDKYYYGLQENVELFSVDEMSLYFSINLKHDFSILSVPEAQKEVLVKSAKPNPPSVSVEQYRDIQGGAGVNVLFLLKNSNDSDSSGLSSNDDPIDRFDVFKLSHPPVSLADFWSGEKIAVSNIVQIAGEKVYLDSNVLVDKVSLGEKYFYIFTQTDIHGLTSSVESIVSVQAEKFGGRYRVSSLEESVDEFFAERKTRPFSSVRRFVCVLPDEAAMKSSRSFYKRYKLKLLSRSSGREFVFRFGVKAGESSEIN